MNKILSISICLLLFASPGFGQTFELTINTNKQSYAVGESIDITAHIKNIGTVPAQIYSPEYWGVSDIVVKNSKGMTINPAMFKAERPFFTSTLTIASGETQSSQFDNLQWYFCGGAKWFENRLTPDTYTIYLTVTNPPQGDCDTTNLGNTDFTGTLTSNTITIEILPAQNTTEQQTIVPEPVPPVPALPELTPEGRKIERVYREDGTVFSETDLFSDKYNGFYKTFHPNGQLATEVRYKDGWEIYDKAFDEQGTPLVRNGTFREYYGGSSILSWEGNYRNDKKQGEFKYYYYDGKTIVDVWHYMNGRRVGSHVRNDAAGNFVSEEDWGYPTPYVQKLQLAVAILGATVLILLFLRVRWSSS